MGIVPFATRTSILVLIMAKRVANAQNLLRDGTMAQWGIAKELRDVLMDPEFELIQFTKTVSRFPTPLVDFWIIARRYHSAKCTSNAFYS